MIAALAGGVGAAKLLQGLYREMEPEQLVVVNTGEEPLAFLCARGGEEMCSTRDVNAGDQVLG